MTTKKLYVSNSEESIRLFENGFMEALSKVHFSVPLVIFLPVIGFLTFKGVTSEALTVIDFVAWSMFRPFGMDSHRIYHAQIHFSF